VKAKEIKKKIMYILGGSIFTEDFFWKNARFIITLIVIVALYISNRYSYIEKMAKVESLQRELKDAKYESLSISVKVMNVNREMKVLEMVKKNGIDISLTEEPTYKIEE